MIHLDHVCLGVQNIYEGAQRFEAETGFGNYDGGHFPGIGLANRIVPLGDDFYIEIESVVDTFEWTRGTPTTTWFRDQLTEGDCFIGWCARVDSRDELERLAKRFGSDIYEGALRTRTDGSASSSARTPDTVRCWDFGVPNFFYLGDGIAKHPARTKAIHRVEPLGVAWMELGGTAEEMSDWLGLPADSLGLRFNGKDAGLHAVAIRTAQGETVIRRPAGKRTLNSSPVASALPARK